MGYTFDMKTSAIVWAVIIIALLGGGYYFYAQSSASAPTGAAGINGSTNQGNLGGTDTGQVQQPGMTGDGSDISANITLGTDGNATLGTYLIGWTGMTVYTYAKDTAGTSTCTGACAEKWPPYIVPEGMHLNIKSGVDENAAGTIRRADGTLQVTYRGMPLYFYVGDTTSSDTNGEGIGGVWHVVKP